jgi:Hepatocellular carcinoma-associated antigen 59
MDTESNTVEATAFRPIKRRKFTRNRQASESDELTLDQVGTGSPNNDSAAVHTPASDIVRLRRSRPRKNGIEFTNTRARSSEPPPQSSGRTVVDTETERIKAISDRFVAHSGQVVDVDRHMFVLPSTSSTFSYKVTETNVLRVAYIESEMAKRRLGQDLPESSNTTLDDQQSNDEDPRPSNKQTLQRQPAAVGKIHEIDLGRDASLRNQQRTELAMRKARGEHFPPDEPAVTKKPRLGRNGKPRRGPKRRNSEDIKRDQLVEQVLHESRREPLLVRGKVFMLTKTSRHI